MSNYSKITDYAAKDLLLHGDAAKAIKGTEVGAEFDAIATMSATKVDSGGALGTPSSGTLTNCTGLPLSGVTDSTTEALGVGSIELGHATDTTITRTGAGAIAVEGVAVLLSGGALGTPSSGTLTNCSGLPVGTGISGLGTGIATALAVNVGSAGSAVVNGGVLGTPSSGTVTNLTGTASININGTVGATTPAVGTFTTLTANTQLIGKGTATNDSAAAGYIGEYAESIVVTGSAVALSTGTVANVTSISLTAGDWDVSGIVQFNTAATTSVIRIVGGISTTSATLDANNRQLILYVGGAVLNTAANGSPAVTVPPTRVSVASTTTVYLVGLSTFSVDTCSAFGKISARRVR